MVRTALIAAGSIAVVVISFAATLIVLSALDAGAEWSDFALSPSCGKATFKVVSSSFKKIGKAADVQFDFVITDTRDCASIITIALPLASGAGGTIPASEARVSGKTVSCAIDGAGQALATCRKADFTNFAPTEHILASGRYRLP